MKFTFQIERDEKLFEGFCAEMPGANGQGATIVACASNLAHAVAMLMDEKDKPVQSTTMLDVTMGGRTRSYQIALTQSWEGFSVSCLDLPGCHSQGEDKDEAIVNIKDAITEYVEVREELTRRKQQLIVAA